MRSLEYIDVFVDDRDLDGVDSGVEGVESPVEPAPRKYTVARKKPGNQSGAGKKRTKRKKMNWQISTLYYKALREETHGSKPTTDSSRRRIQYRCLCDECPEEYVFPKDRDVLGDLPPS